MGPAIAIVEFDSIPHGIAAGDAMVKRAPLQLLLTGTVHPGRYLLLAAGLTAEVEEALVAAETVGAPGLLARTFLPDVHPDVVAAIGGTRREAGEALGVIETRSVAAIVRAADVGTKHANVVLRELRLADGLGGKGYLLFGGPLTEVEAAVMAALERLAADGVTATHAVVAQLHPEMDDNLRADARFAVRSTGIDKTGAPAPPSRGRR
jgi:microcompartment protein CcmL/EutN